MRTPTDAEVYRCAKAGLIAIDRGNVEPLPSTLSDVRQYIAIGCPTAPDSVAGNAVRDEWAAILAENAPASVIAVACESARVFLSGDWRAYVLDRAVCTRIDEMRHQLRSPSPATAESALALIGEPAMLAAPETERRAIMRGLIGALKPGVAK